MVLHYARKHKTEQLKTFSIIFESEEYSEKEWIDKAANANAVEQNQYLLGSADFANLFECATWHCDSPLNHPNSIGIFLLCKEAKKDVTVLMTGEGADEVFGGYGRYTAGIWYHNHPFMKRLIDWLRGKEKDKRNFRERSVGYTQFVKLDLLAQYVKCNCIEEVFSDRYAIFEEACGRNEMEKWLNYELKTYLVDILNRQDKMSMAASVETRVPFLDYRLVETVRSRKVTSYVGGAGSLFRGGHCTKKPLKKLASKFYGKAFAYREKSGFPIPLGQFFLNSEFVDYVENSIFPELERSNLFYIEKVKRLWERREVCKKNEIELLWVIIAHGAWMKLFLGEKSGVVNYQGRQSV